MYTLMDIPKARKQIQKYAYDIEKYGIKKYEIWMADMREGIGSEQVGRRPVIILQNDIGNKFSPTVLVAPLTSSISKRRIPTHVFVRASINKLECDSVILCEQIVTLDKSRLKHKICKLDNESIRYVDNAIAVSLGIKIA